MTYPIRTRFAKDIVAEVMAPARKGGRTRVVILCDGAPSVPASGPLLGFFAKKGFWAIAFRYRGSWESDGTFLRHSPEEDVRAIIDGLPKGFTGFWDGKRYRVSPDEIFVVGASFGGTAAILASHDPRVKKIVAVSPVVDWRAPSKEEPMDWLEGFFHDAFGNGYRFGRKEWKKLSSGAFYSPVREAPSLDGRTMLIFHAKDDATVRYRDVASFAKNVDARLVTLAHGGHLSKSAIVPKYWTRIAAFFRAHGSRRRRAGH